MANNTIFDDVFRTMMERMPQLIIPELNEVFGTNYPVDIPVVQWKISHVFSTILRTIFTGENWTGLFGNGFGYARWSVHWLQGACHSNGELYLRCAFSEKTFISAPVLYHKI